MIIDSNERRASSGAFADRGPRIEGFADRLIDVYVGRSGSDDTGATLDELQDSSTDLVRDLAELVVSLAFRAADAMTVHDISRPDGRLVPAKVNRLRRQLEEATQLWLKELKGVSHG